MYKYLLMFISCIVTGRIYSKPLFEYNIKPEYKLVPEGSSSYFSYWPDSEYFIAPQIRFKHHANPKGHGRGHGHSNHESPHDFGYADDHNYSDSEEYSGGIYHPSHPHHPHGVPPGQAKKHGPYYNRPHEIPPRFPPPPVYDKDFINPWTLGATTPKVFIVQQPPLTTPRPFIVRQPPLTTPAKAKTLTSPAPPSAAGDDDELIYDIDVRFGRQ